MIVCSLFSILEFMEDQKVYYLLLVLGVVFFVFSLYIFHKTIKALRLINKSKSWPSTNGTILNAKLRHHIDNFDEQASVKFFLIIEYNYQILDKNFNSEKRYASDSILNLKFKPASPKEKEVKKLLSLRKLKKPAYREKVNELLENFKGDKIKVFYNPENPGQACLLTDTPMGIYGHFIGATLILTASVGLLFL